MKNTKNLFMASLFGCFLLPILTVIVAALSVFLKLELATWFIDWVFGGGIWMLFVYQIIIILITVMLGLTIKLKDVQSLTTDKVVKGKKNTDRVVRKVNTLDLDKIDTPVVARKEIKAVEKRVVVKNDLEEETPKPRTTQVNNTTTKDATTQQPQKRYPAAPPTRR